jgi:hypothetical protein
MLMLGLWLIEQVAARDRTSIRKPPLSRRTDPQQSAHAEVSKIERTRWTVKHPQPGRGLGSPSKYVMPVMGSRLPGNSDAPAPLL